MADKSIFPPQFEYLHEHISAFSDNSLTNQLNRYGSEGWELITCDRTVTNHVNDPGADIYYTCIFKRESRL